MELVQVDLSKDLPCRPFGAFGQSRPDGFICLHSGGTGRASLGHIEHLLKSGARMCYGPQTYEHGLLLMKKPINICCDSGWVEDMTKRYGQYVSFLTPIHCAIIQKDIAMLKCLLAIDDSSGLENFNCTYFCDDEFLDYMVKQFDKILKAWIPRKVAGVLIDREKLQLPFFQDLYSLCEREFPDTFLQCEREIELMKTKKYNDILSDYDVLTWPLWKVAHYVENGIVSLLENRFVYVPCAGLYESKVKRKIYEAKCRKSAVQEVESLLREVIRNSPSTRHLPIPDEICTMILDYVTSKELSYMREVRVREKSPTYTYAESLSLMNRMTIKIRSAFINK